MKQDICVVGGGMVGAALALGLSQSGFEVALIEGRPPERDWPAGSIGTRVSALSRASQNLLVKLDAWSAMEALGVTPYRQMQVWDVQGKASISFDAQEIGEPDLGHIVENRITQVALWQRLEQANVRLLCPARVTALDLSQAMTSGVLLTLDDGRQIETRLVLAADGAGSPIRQMAGIDTLGWRYDHHALVTTVHLAQGHGQSARQFFLPGAILAFLPLQDDLCSIVWSCPAEQAQSLKTMAEDDFIEQLAKASGQRLGPMAVESERAIFPLRLQHTRSYVRPGLALLGDAAHVIHPLAGQGVNLGFMDVIALINALEQGRQAGRSPGHLRDLRAFERARKGDNLGMMFAMDGFKRLFGSSSPVLSLGRGLGLQLADRLAPLNHLCIRQALGL